MPVSEQNADFEQHRIINKQVLYNLPHLNTIYLLGKLALWSWPEGVRGSALRELIKFLSDPIKQSHPQTICNSARSLVRPDGANTCQFKPTAGVEVSDNAVTGQ